MSFWRRWCCGRCGEGGWPRTGLAVKGAGRPWQIEARGMKEGGTGTIGIVAGRARRLGARLRPAGFDRRGWLIG